MNRLEQIRKQKKLNKAQMARFLEMPRTTYVQYETGERRLPVEVAFKIAPKLGVKWHRLYERVKSS